MKLVESRSSGNRFRAARALEKHFNDAQATEALITALKDEDAAVRYAAATSLEMHLARCSNQDTRAIKKKILNALVYVLDDSESDWIAIPVYGPLLPGVLGRTPSVRARALMVLTLAMGDDFGFDKKTWRAEIEKRLPGTSVALDSTKP